MARRPTQAIAARKEIRTNGPATASIDVVTAPAYNMTIPYFALYLFSLPGYDILLASLVAVIAMSRHL